jgi:hypothetical protein
VKLGIIPLNIYGKLPPNDKANQPSVTIRYPSFCLSFFSCSLEKYHNMNPRFRFIAEEIKIGYVSPSK